MYKLKEGDKIAIVSLSSGILGDKNCEYQLTLGIERLKEFGLVPIFMKNSLKGSEILRNNPKLRANDLIEAFKDNEIKGIICAIGGDDTYKLTEYILNEKNIKIIKENPKFFMGYSDTTVNHLILYKLGIKSFYGMSFLTDFAEKKENLLEYSKNSFLKIFTEENFEYTPSKYFYDEREKFDLDTINNSRKRHKEKNFYESLVGNKNFSGKLIGGCIETIYDMLVGERYKGKEIVNEKYSIIPTGKEYENHLLFLETSEDRIKPEKLEEMLKILEKTEMFKYANGLIIGKPQNEKYYEEYKEIYLKILKKYKIPIVYNVNIGHAYPKMLLQYGAYTTIDVENQKISVIRE